MREKAALLGVMVAAIMLTTGSAGAVTYAPVDRPGPPLDVPAAQLAAGLSCPALPAAAQRDVVLLIPGTTVDPDQAFAWNYEAALQAQGIPYCTVTVPNHTDGDIQVAAEYVVHAVRTIRQASGRPVVMLGWSQGASTLPRWALRFWPDIRPMVASLIGLAPLNNTGSVVGNAPCLGGSCIPAAWQQAIGSNFMAALNSGQQTFPGIAYSAIYTRFDDVVTPDFDGGLSRLPPGPNVLNVAIQDVCPADLTDHLGIVASAGGYAVAMPAIQHPGQLPDLNHLAIPQPCVDGAMPYVTPAGFLSGEAGVVAPIPARLLQGTTTAEPPLRCYVTASCPGGAPTQTVVPSTAGTGAGALSRGCADRLSFVLHARRGRHIVRAVVRVSGRPVQTILGKGAARLQIRPPARAKYRITITSVDNRGARRTTERRYRGCSKTRPRHTHRRR
ncbi:MAG: esterase/lipase family protein [Solirubrobacteraceae bacterium]